MLPLKLNPHRSDGSVVQATIHSARDLILEQKLHKPHRAVCTSGPQRTRLKNIQSNGQFSPVLVFVATKQSGEIQHNHNWQDDTYKQKIWWARFQMPSLKLSTTRLYIDQLIVNIINRQITTIIVTNMLYVWKYIYNFRLKALTS